MCRSHDRALQSWGLWVNFLRYSRFEQQDRSVVVNVLIIDDEIICKTVSHKESRFLQEILPAYYLNLHQNIRTLLPKFFGFYCYSCKIRLCLLLQIIQITNISLNLQAILRTFVLLL